MEISTWTTAKTRDLALHVAQDNFAKLYRLTYLTSSHWISIDRRASDQSFPQSHLFLLGTRPRRDRLSGKHTVPNNNIPHSTFTSKSSIARSFTMAAPPVLHHVQKPPAGLAGVLNNPADGHRDSAYYSSKDPSSKRERSPKSLSDFNPL